MVTKPVKYWTCTNMQKRPQARKLIFLGLESKKSENGFQILKNEKYLKFAPANSVQNASYAFPNELTRFRI